MVEFTPGPWKATERSGYHEVLGARNHADWYGTKEVWAVAYCDTDREEDEQIANAHLIAAAPELFEALEALRNHVITHACTWDEAGNGSHHHPIWTQVSDALVKALGQ